MRRSLRRTDPSVSPALPDHIEHRCGTFQTPSEYEQAGEAKLSDPQVLSYGGPNAPPRRNAATPQLAMPGVSMWCFILTFPGMFLNWGVIFFSLTGFVTGLIAVSTLPRVLFGWIAFVLNTAALTFWVMLFLGMIRF